MKKVLALLFVICSMRAFAQTDGNTFSLPNVMPPAPQSAALGRYGDIPVAINTGVPNISVPMFNITSGKLSLPISINYHASGVKVSDMASPTGLGWALSAGGDISRVVQGQPDESTYGFPTIKFPYAGDPSLAAKEKCLANFMSSSYDASINAWDGQPDLFFFSVGNKSGQFLSKNSISKYQQPGFMTIPYFPINIAVSNVYQNFTITDDDGTKYFFNRADSSSTDGSTAPRLITYATAWHLVKMLSADKADSIVFKYNVVSHFGYNTNPSRLLQLSYDGESGLPVVFTYAVPTSSKVAVTEYLLSEIDFNNGKVTMDYGNAYATNQTMILNAVHLFNIHNGNYAELKRFTLYHSPFLNNSASSNVSRLDSIRETGYYNNNVITNPSTVFSYFSYGGFQCPPFNSYAQDLWGYFNGQTGNTDMDFVIPGTTATAPYLPVAVVSPVKRLPDSNYMKVGSITGIKYPTGGTTVFALQANQIASPVTQNVNVANPPALNVYISNFGASANSSAGFSSTFTVNSSLSGAYQSGSGPYATLYNTQLTFQVSPSCASGSANCVYDQAFVQLNDITNGAPGPIVSQLMVNSPSATTPSTQTALFNLVQGHKYTLSFPYQPQLPNSSSNFQYRLDANINAYTGAAYTVVAQTIANTCLTGGLRVKSITSSDGNGKTLNKQYSYTGSYFNSPLFNGNYSTLANTFAFDGWSLYKGFLGDTVINQMWWGPGVTTYSPNLPLPLGSVCNNALSYNEVVEYDADGNGNYNGKTVYDYNSMQDGVTIKEPFFRISNEDARALLTQKRVYKNSNGGYSLIKNIVNNYTNLDASMTNADTVVFYTVHALADNITATHISPSLPNGGGASDTTGVDTEIDPSAAVNQSSADIEQSIKAANILQSQGLNMDNMLSTLQSEYEAALARENTAPPQPGPGTGPQIIPAEAADGCLGCNGFSAASQFLINRAFYTTSRYVLSSSTVTDIDNSGNALTSTTSYNYQNPVHAFPTHINTVNSEGKTTDTYLTYVLDQIASPTCTNSCAASLSQLINGTNSSFFKAFSNEFTKCTQFQYTNNPLESPSGIFGTLSTRIADSVVSYQNQYAQSMLNYQFIVDAMVQSYNTCDSAYNTCLSNYYANTATTDQKGVIDLQTQNNITAALQTTHYTNNVLNTTLQNYFQTYSPGVTKPSRVMFSTMSNTPETRLVFNQYDTHGNVKQAQKAGGEYHSYIWDYLNTYPIAEVTNAAPADIAYTSFEADGSGNWTIGSPLRDTTNAITGSKSYVLSNGPISISGLTASTTYIVSYWTKNNAAYLFTGSVAGSTVQGPKINGWTYFQTKVTGVTSFSMTGTNNIDELRLYPSTAQMTTSTYTPFVGVTSQCAANNKIIYYQYDGLQRISSIKDQYGNIIKSYCYNYAGQPYGCAVPQGSPVQPIESVSTSSFVTSNLMDNEWKQEAPTAPVVYSIAPDDGTTINPAGTAGANAGRFAYFSTGGSLASPITDINGTLSFTAKGSGTIEIQLIATWDSTIVARKTFALTADYQDYSWQLTGLYPQLEMIMGVLVNGGNSSPQASVQFQNNFSLNLAQCGLTGTFQRFRADATSLIGNSETGWYGWNDNAKGPRKKYLQHSAYSRMRFNTTASSLVIEYVRDFYDRQVVNLFPVGQTLNGYGFGASGAPASGMISAINDSIKVKAGQWYTVSGLTTYKPTCVWYDSKNNPLGVPAPLTTASLRSTPAAPVYIVHAPANAAYLGLLVQNTSDNYLVYANCMVETDTPRTTNNIPLPFTAYSGNTPSYLSGPAVFVNGIQQQYLQVEGTDQPKVIQYVTCPLPAVTNGASNVVEVMMPGQSTYPYTPLSPPVRRSGTFLRAVYFPGSSTTVYPSTTVVSNSIAYIHDSILSGYNITSDAQDSVWMMAVKRNPAYGFKGDVFSEGYAGRILYTDINNDALTTAFAKKLASFGVNNYWFQIGVNDYGFMTPLPLFYKQYKSLIEKLEGLNPNAKIYIQSTGPESYEGPNGETISDNGLAATGPAANDFRDVQRALATSHAYCRYVNFEGLFAATPANTADGIHPTNAGNKAYADGIKAKSDLLGTVLPATPLAFYRNTTRPMIQTVSGIYTVTATGGTAPYTFSLVSGTLPSGLTFNPDGTITGTPTSSGTFSLTVKVTDHASATVTETVSLTVKPVPVITAAASAGSIVGTTPSSLFVTGNTASTVTFSGVNGYGPYTFLPVTGSLPPNMSFNQSTGVLSGVPPVTAIGNTYTFTISVKDHWGFTGSTTFTMAVLSGQPTDNFTVTASVSATNHLLLTGHINGTYNTTLTAYVAGYYSPTYSPTQLFLGGNLSINPGSNTSAPTDMGLMLLLSGPFPVQTQIGGIYPATFGNTTVNFSTSVSTPPTNLNATVSAPTEPITATVTNAAGTLTMSLQLPKAPVQAVNVGIGVVFTQNGKSTYQSWPTAVINPGSAASQPMPLTLSPLSPGAFTAWLVIGYVTPDNGTIVDIAAFNKAAQAVPLQYTK